MADDQLRAVFAQWRRERETGAQPQLRTRRATPPPPSSTGGSSAAPAPPHRRLQPTASDRVRHGYARDDRKDDPSLAWKPPSRDVSDSTTQGQRRPPPAADREREKQREKQMALERRMASSVAATTTPASSGAVYYELESPARPLEHGAFGYHASNHHAAPAPRRVSPTDVMQELDDDFRRSFQEHQHASETLDDDEDETRDTFDGSANGHAQRGRSHAAPPPVVEVRVQHVHPPFREEVSSDLSDHARTPRHSREADGNATSEEAGAHFPISGEFDSIPSISLTPPASPAHRPARNATEATQHPPNRASYPADQRRERDASPKEVVFPMWSIGFLAGCVAVGLGGIFMEELMQFGGVFIKPSPFSLSRIDQREMNRRLDLLQQELQSFRVAATEIEQQSQRMVQEVRTHLEKMKSERDRHQQMISREMDALRRYVQAVTTELVEDEKKEIRKRLLETIADTIVELPDDVDDGVEVGSIDGTKSKQSILREAKPSAAVNPAIKQNDRQSTGDVVETAISAVESDATTEFVRVDDNNVQHQVDRAVASGSKAAHAVIRPKLSGNTSTATHVGKDDPESSLFSFELLALLVGVVLIAGIVGVRVRNAHRRKILNRARKTSVFLPRFGVKKSAPATTEESDVETVSFFRSDVEESDTDYRSTGPSDGEWLSEDYSEEEEKEGERGDEYELTGGYEESVSARSDRDDYDFQPAESGGDLSTHSDVESLDESPSTTSVDPPTPYPRMRQQLKDRLADESPAVRRSPRVQTTRSQLSHMR